MERCKKILVADDDAMIGRSLEVRLRHAGYEVDVAHDGLEAAQFAELGDPDLVLLDVFMPGLDGFEVIDRMRQDPRLIDTPVIALTASKAPLVRDRLLRRGVRACFEKPFEAHEILDWIGREL